MNPFRLVSSSILSLVLLLAVERPVSGEIPTSGFARCLSIDRTSNSLTAFIINSCPQKLMVRWTDEKSCRTYCALDVGPNSRASAGEMTGQVWMGACEWPTPPKSDDGMMTYSCGGAKNSGNSVSGAPRVMPSNPSGSQGSARQNPGSGSSNRSAPPPPPPPLEPRPAKRLSCPPVEDFYPPAAKRAEEQGRVIVRVSVASNGSAAAVMLEQSSGNPRLDEAAAKYARACRYTPGVPESGEQYSIARLGVTFVLQ